MKRGWREECKIDSLIHVSLGVEYVGGYEPCKRKKVDEESQEDEEEETT